MTTRIVSMEETLEGAEVVDKPGRGKWDRDKPVVPTYTFKVAMCGEVETILALSGIEAGRLYCYKRGINFDKLRHLISVEETIPEEVVIPVLTPLEEVKAFLAHRKPKRVEGRVWE